MCESDHPKCKSDHVTPAHSPPLTFHLIQSKSPRPYRSWLLAPRDLVANPQHLWPHLKLLSLSLLYSSHAVWNSLTSATWPTPSFPLVLYENITISLRLFLVTLPKIVSPGCPTSIPGFVFLPRTYHHLIYYRLGFLFSICLPLWDVSSKRAGILSVWFTVVSPEPRTVPAVKAFINICGMSKQISNQGHPFIFQLCFFKTRGFGVSSSAS